MATQAAVGRTHPGSTVCSTDTLRGSSGCCRIDMSRGSILCCRTGTSRDRTRCCRTDSFRDKLLKLGSRRPSSIHGFQLVSVCFGLFRFISVYSGLFRFNRNKKLAVSLWKRNNRNKRFVSDSAETSFGCFESKLVSKDTLPCTQPSVRYELRHARKAWTSTLVDPCLLSDRC
jgi:hypothetical protein